MITSRHSHVDYLPTRIFPSIITPEITDTHLNHVTLKNSINPGYFGILTFIRDALLYKMFNDQFLTGTPPNQTINFSINKLTGPNDFSSILKLARDKESISESNFEQLIKNEKKLSLSNVKRTLSVDQTQKPIVTITFDFDGKSWKHNSQNARYAWEFQAISS